MGAGFGTSGPLVIPNGGGDPVSTDISDSTAVGRNLLTATDAAAAQATINAARTYLPSTPVLQWACTEAAGATTLANSGSLGSADLTIAGSPDVGRPTELGRAVRWTGNSDDVPPTEYASGATGAEPAAPITVLAWVRAAAWTNPYAKIVFRTSRSTWGTGGVEGVGLRLAGGAEAGVNAGGWCAVVTTGTAGSGATTILQASSTGAWRRLTLGRWHLVALTYDGTTLRAYCDGYEVASTAVSGALDYGISGTRYWMLGGNADPLVQSECWDGEIREAQVYGSVLSAATLRQIYERGVGIWAGA